MNYKFGIMLIKFVGSHAEYDKIDAATVGERRLIMMTVKPIRTESDYEVNLERIEYLIDAEPGTPDGDELDFIATLIKRYENQRFPMEAPTPLAAIRLRMEQAELTPKDLEPFIGARARVSEVLSGTRALSIDMIQALNEHLGIPTEVLIRAEAPQ